MREQKVVVWENGKFGMKMQKFRFSAYMQATDLLQTFQSLTSIFPFRRNTYNVHSPFYPSACGGKHALLLQISAKLDSAFVVQLPFRTGSKHGRAYLRH